MIMIIIIRMTNIGLEQLAAGGVQGLAGQDPAGVLGGLASGLCILI